MSDLEKSVTTESTEFVNTAYTCKSFDAHFLPFAKPVVQNGSLFLNRVELFLLRSLTRQEKNAPTQRNRNRQIPRPVSGCQPHPNPSRDQEREQRNAASNPRQASLHFSVPISHSTHALANPRRFLLPFSFFFCPFQPSSPPRLPPFPRFRCSSLTFRSRKEPILSCCWRFCFLSSLGS
jgi:hypothetical protein